MTDVTESNTGRAGLLDRLARSGAIQTSRTLDHPWLRGATTGLSLTFVTLYWYYAGWGYFTPESFVALFLGFTFILIILCYGASSGSPSGRLSLIDIVLLLGAVGATIHYSLYFPTRFVDRFGEPAWHDIIAGTALVLVALEAGRRVIGTFLPGLCIVLIFYALFGPYFPGMFQHPGITLWDVIGWLYSSEGIYGSITRVFASFVFLFVVLGTMLEQSGGRNLFIDIPLSALGWLKGGPAKVAVVASALFGMISGAAAANVVSTGTLTIPLMKRAGFAPHAAGAFEATASTIGITMPPLMGAAIFIMSDFTGIPYIEIVKVSVIPALLFVVSLLMIADAYARHHRIEGLPRSEFGDPWALLKVYWPFLIPIGLVVGLLVSGRSPDAAVFYSLPSVILVSLLYKQTRMPVRRWAEVLDLGVRRSLTIGGIAGCLGIIVGIVVKTGLAVKLSHIVIDYSMGYLLVAILLTALATFFLGMGVSSVTADYILLSVLIAPALTELGASVMAANLLIIWYTQTSNLTPPVCTVAFAAAAIADAHPWRTGFLAFRFGLFIYLIPLAFVYGGMLDFSDPVLLTRTTLAALIAGYAFSGALIGYRAGALSTLQRVMLLVASFLLFVPSWTAIGIGLALTAVAMGYQVLVRREAVPVVAKAAPE
jgi:TRAP transporter 4TM/12TM fusion protein